MRVELARRQWDDLENLEAAIERTIAETERPGVRATLPEESTYRCSIDYIGAYAYWDLPSGVVDDGHRDIEDVEDSVDTEDSLPAIDRENDPPIADVWK